MSIGEGSEKEVHTQHAGGRDEHADHSGHDRGDHVDMFRHAFWRNLALAIPVLVFSGQIQDWFNYDWSFPGSQWIAPVLGTVIYFYGGQPFLSGGIEEARNRQPGMMLLIALAIPGVDEPLHDHRRSQRPTPAACRSRDRTSLKRMACKSEAGRRCTGGRAQVNRSSVTMRPVESVQGPSPTGD